MLFHVVCGGWCVRRKREQYEGTVTSMCFVVMFRFAQSGPKMLRETTLFFFWLADVTRAVTWCITCRVELYMQGFIRRSVYSMQWTKSVRNKHGAWIFIYLFFHFGPCSSCSQLLRALAEGVCCRAR